MKILRIILVLAVLAYAGWLAWPVVSSLLAGPPEIAGPNARIAMESADLSGAWLSGAWLWIVAAVLYVVAAVLLGAGNPKAAIAYFLGFLADAALRLAIDRQGSATGSDMGPMGADIAARSAEAVAPAGLSVDPTWLVLGVLLLVGVLIFAISRRRARKRTPGHLAA